MAYITKVHIQGFQSHTDSTFTLSPGLSVITGPSDAGKTAIIRALRWLAFNEPQGEAFIHVIRDGNGDIISQADQATVTVELDDGVIISKTRRKGKTVYTHNAYADAWEKAELPLEIKESLGLEKRTYGDSFDTCLNFAYQLDPPFLLSETGSTGAKVLGKLAGTEVVDKSIGAVAKQLHHTRDAIRQADKLIGQYDVELLDYLNTEENLKLVEALESDYEKVQEKVETHKTLSALLDRFVTYNIKHNEAYIVTERLKTVPELVDTLEAIENAYAYLRTYKELSLHFWDLVNQRKKLKLQSQALENVPELYTDLHAIRENSVRLDNLENAAERYRAATNSVVRLQHTLDRLAGVIGLQAKLDALGGAVDRLRALRRIRQLYEYRAQAVNDATYDVRTASRVMDAVRQELTEAWEAAGGVCPLCNQPVKGCRH